MAETVTVETLISEHPTLLATFILGMPGALTGSHTNGPLQARLRMGPPLNEQAEELLRRRGPRGLRFTLKATIHEYGQMLAKISHAYAHAEGKFDAYSPTLQAIVRDGSLPQSRFIGGEANIPPRGETLQEIGLQEAHDLLIVRIRLFSKYSGPVYYVVAGIRADRAEA